MACGCPSKKKRSRSKSKSRAKCEKPKAKARAKAKCGKSGCPRIPINGFIFYFLKQLRKHKRMPASQVAQQAACEWNQLDKKKKRKFIRRAKKFNAKRRASQGCPP